MVDGDGELTEGQVKWWSTWLGATIAAELEAELAGTRVFQLFVRHLGPDDVFYASAFALDASGNVVEAKASAMEKRP